MSKFYMKLYDIFNSIAGYFWKKALQPRKKENEVKKGLTPKQKKLPKVYRKLS